MASGKARRLWEGDGLDPAWSPDGRYIAYWGMSIGANDPDGGATSGTFPRPAAPIVITHDAPVDWNPVWCPTGAAVLLSDRGGGMNLWRVGIDPPGP